METIRKINKTICFLFTLINFIFYSNVCFASISWEILQQSFCSMSRKSTPLAAFFSHSTCLSLTQRTSLLQRTVRTVKPTFYYCLRDFSTDSKSLGANEPSISEVAKRILTIGIREPYDPVIGSLQHAFHSYQYWQRHYNYKDKVLIEDKNSQHQLFDRLLCERIEKQRAWRPTAAQFLLPYHMDYNIYLERKAQGDAIAKIEKNLIKEKSFLDGHMLPVTGKTNFPMVLVNIHSRYKGQSTKTIRWWAPLQEAIRSQTLGQHMQRLALNRLWDSYSHMAMLVIPAGAFIDCRIGIVAPRMVPDLEVESLRTTLDPVRKALEKAVDLKSLTESQIQGLIEDLRGASSQLYSQFL